MRAGDDELRRGLRRRLQQGRTEPRRRQPTSGTWPELVVADWLDRWGMVYETQHELLPGVTVDFWLPDRLLAIECQGTWHHGDPAQTRPAELTAGPARKRRHDAALQAWCDRAEVTLVEVWEADLRADPAAAMAALGRCLAPDQPEGTTTMSEVLRQRTLAGGCELLICRGDLTAEPVAAIVNAANSHLAHGGGVAGAIARRGGAVIQSASDAWVRAHGPVPTGQAALTPAGALPCRAVIHAVGPVWRGGSHGEREDLASAVRSALVLAAEHELETVALPAISSGIFGFPKELCAEILISTVVECDAANPGGLPRAVRLTNLDDLTVGILADEFDRRWPRL